MMPLETDRLAELVRRKHACLVQLLDLGSQQCAVVNGGDVNDLLRILGAKQLLIQTMQELETGLNPFREQDPESRQWRNSADRDACGKLLAQCDQLFRTILEQERASESQLRRRRDETALQLHESRAAAEIRGAYAHESAAGIGTLDLTNEV